MCLMCDGGDSSAAAASFLVSIFVNEKVLLIRDSSRWGRGSYHMANSPTKAMALSLLSSADGVFFLDSRGEEANACLSAYPS